MSDQKRMFVGSGKRVKNYDLINISVCMSDLPENAIKEYKGKKYINLTVGGKKNGADEYGKTHSVWVNDFVPQKRADRSEENAQPSTKVDYADESNDSQEIPW